MILCFCGGTKLYCTLKLINIAATKFTGFYCMRLIRFVVGIHDIINDACKDEITYRAWDKKTSKLACTLRLSKKRVEGICKKDEE